MANLCSDSTRPHRSYTTPAPPACSTSRRTRNRSATVHSNNTNDLPWHHMAQTYAWVVENEYNTVEKSNRKTEQWILEQQVFLAAESADRRKDSTRQQRAWDDKVYLYEIEAERWRRNEEEARKRAADKERKERLLMDQVRRIEINMQHRREEQRKKMVEERRKCEEGLKERERQSRLKSERIVVEAWRDYEERWRKLMASSEKLSFSRIPWPLVSTPRNAEGITPQAVVGFLFSPLHSEKQTRKERLRNGQLRWHPDRFQRVLDRVRDEDKAQVSKGAGIVARCLNDIK